MNLYGSLAPFVWPALLYIVTWFTEITIHITHVVRLNFDDFNRYRALIKQLDLEDAEILEQQARINRANNRKTYR